MGRQRMMLSSDSSVCSVLTGLFCCAQDTDRDFFMGAEEATEYGLIDAVISRPQLIAATNGATPSS